MFYKLYLLIPKMLRLFWWTRVKGREYMIEMEDANGVMVDITPFVKSCSFDGELFEAEMPITQETRRIIKGR